METRDYLFLYFNDSMKIYNVILSCSFNISQVYIFLSLMNSINVPYVLIHVSPPKAY